jgi:hypothetical protein
MTTKTEKELFIEWHGEDSEPSDVVRKGYRFKVLRGFRLKTCDGPLTEVRSGTEVILFDSYLIHFLFIFGKLDPILPGIQDVAEYISLRFWHVVQDGKYANIKTDQVVRLTREEALIQLRALNVKPVMIDDANFYFPGLREA